jgi:hypothetical protein
MKKLFILLLAAFCTASMVNAQCSCGTTPETRWSGIMIKKNRSGALQKITCGYQFAVNCKDTIWYAGGQYRCEGSCLATYKANIFKATTLIRTIEPFSFTTGYLTFSAAGAYKVEIRPQCGGASCKPCLFYFTVTDPGCR